jgi:glycosyltransferase involved in cell wall biosynthesis
VKRAAFAVPGNLDTPTGGYTYDKRIITELRALGWQIDVIDLGASFPDPDRAMREAALAKLLALPEGCPIVIDGLAYGVMAVEASLLSGRNPLVALVHHPLALETGLDADVAADLQDSERAALVHARAVIVTGASTVPILTRDYDVAPELIAVIVPGTDRPHRAKPGPKASKTIGLLAVGSVIPRKGYGILIEALSGLRELPWSLTIAGDTGRDPETFLRLKASIEAFALQERVAVAGAVSNARLAELYASADVFVLASLFEGYGMVFGEAIAQGLPIVATDVGAARALVPPDAGILVAPGDVDALRAALRRVVADANLRATMVEAVCKAASQLPRWQQSAADFARVLETCL